MYSGEMMVSIERGNWYQIPCKRTSLKHSPELCLSNGSNINVFELHSRAKLSPQMRLTDFIHYKSCSVY